MHSDRDDILTEISQPRFGNCLEFHTFKIMSIHGESTNLWNTVKHVETEPPWDHFLCSE